MRYAKVFTATGRVVNVEEWDGDTTKWAPPADCTMIASATANIGDHWDGAVFTANPLPPPPDPYATQKANIIALRNTPEVIALFAADPATLNPTQRALKATIVAFRALVKIVRGELEE